MPSLLPENRRALDLYADLKALGWEAALSLNRLELTDYDRGSLLLKLRTIAGTVSEIEREKMKAAGSGGAG